VESPLAAWGALVTLPVMPGGRPVGMPGQLRAPLGGIQLLVYIPPQMSALEAIYYLASTLPKRERAAFTAETIAKFKAAGGVIADGETPHVAEPRPEPADTARATPKASDGLEWPSETWKGSTEELSRKPYGLIAYLRRVWKPFIDENNVIVTKSILKKRDPSLAAALKTYLQHVGELPDDIRIMSDDELKECIASHPIMLPRLAMQ
jgi:hypothetical protein